MIQTVYIASPYTLGDKEQNVNLQIDAAEYLAQCGLIPYWPLHSHYWHVKYPHDWHFWMDISKAWLLRCDAVLRLPGESKGADQEVELAIARGIPVYHSIHDLLTDIQRKASTPRTPTVLPVGAK